MSHRSPRWRALVAAALAALIALAAGAAAPLAAQARITSSVDTTRITVGGRIRLSVSVEHPADARVAWPDSLVLTPFEVVEASAGPPRVDGVRATSTATLSITAFELGELEIPSFEVAVVGPGDEREVLETDRFGVEVVSVGVDEGGDIREIRGPLSIPMGALWLLALLALVLVPALLAFFLYRRRRGGGGESPGRRGPPPRPAHELALAALAEVEASPLLARGQVKEFHIAVSEILRLYVERRFRIDALEMTSREVLDGLARAGVDEEFRSGFGRFLDQCDLVKFAKVRPTPEASLAVLQLGRTLVESSIPAVPIPDVDVEPDGDEPVDAPSPDAAAEEPRHAGGEDDRASAEPAVATPSTSAPRGGPEG